MEHNYATELHDSELHDFLVNAPKKFRENERIKKFQMKNGDFIHCCLWNYHFYISGTDIVKILIYRFQLEGRQINNLKKFEEGIFSDLRNLKPGIDATLEGPRSDFLEFMYKNGCIRTQKKQKVFYWYSVPHDALFCDAMERDMRRETFFVSSKNYSNKSYAMNNLIFSSPKTNRNTTKQRKDSLFMDTDLFGTERKEKGDILSKALFNQDDSMSNIIKKSQKKSNILDEIVNYNKRTVKKESVSDEFLFSKNQRFDRTSSVPTESTTLRNTNLSELDQLIESADLRLQESAQAKKSPYIDINDFLYTSRERKEEAMEMGSKVAFVSGEAKKNAE
ncbi:transcription factor STE12 [Ecytonucleospora hepatopenaei]|uniref:Transcription factor STE12 n=1 Tax=Ecytonucleospora hepatopenaei TaxID=646526 RepID=A0A1W0E818_9MICR|nr:transcription factor STE12 [Ecytonucleospora hepatopenaei]